MCTPSVYIDITAERALPCLITSNCLTCDETKPAICISCDASSTELYA